MRKGMVPDFSKYKKVFIERWLSIPPLLVRTQFKGQPTEIRQLSSKAP